MSRSSEWMVEPDSHEAEESAARQWAHQQELERHEREEAALERARLQMAELRQLIHELKLNRTPT